MKIDSPSSITSREASIRLEWIYLRILPGVAVLLISIPLCQWLALNLPDGIVPVYLIYIMIVIVLWSIYLAIQYAIAGIVQTRKTMNKVTIENSNSHEEDGQTPVFLLEAMPIVAESNGTESVCQLQIPRSYRKRPIPAMNHPLFRLLLPARPINKALMTSTKVRQKARRRNLTLFMNTFYTSCPLLFTRKTWTISVQTF